MPFADLQNARLWYEIDGPNAGPVLILSHSLGADLSLWDAVVPSITTAFRVLRYDTRGHGRSVYDHQPLTIQTLADDVIGLLDHVGAESAFFCGVSLGGLTGMRLCLSHGSRIRRAVLSNTAARIGTIDSWNQRIAAVKAGGLHAVVGPVLERSFTLKYRSTNAAVVDKMRRTMLNADPEGYCECCVVLRDTDLREQVSGISTACMIMTGSEDPATPITDAEFLAEHIPGAAYSLIPGAHLCCIESADAFARSALTFLQDESR